MSKTSKRLLVHKFFASIYSLFNKRKIIVFDACLDFHLKHLISSIEALSLKNDFDIFVISESHRDFTDKKITVVSGYDKLPMYRKAAAFITTEFGRNVYWLDCPDIYFGHGAGPKLNYAGSEELKKFDYVFSSCQPIYDAQIKYIKIKENILKVGLPILEDDYIKKREVLNELKLNYNKPTILYAPSWCTDIQMVSNIRLIICRLQELSTSAGVNVIISPHPLLFIPERCNGEVFFPPSYLPENIYINRPNGKYSSLDLVRICDITISDISSLMFEAMALRKNVLFDGNKKIYTFSDAIFWYDSLIKVCEVPNWENKLDNTILDALKQDKARDRRNEFIDNYMFNIGSAKKTFVEHIYKICHNVK